jgi:nuclear receptor subfamily 1 group D protein 3
LAAMQQSSNSRSQEKAVAAELEDEQRLLSTVIRAHLDTCDFTRDKVEPMLARARDQPSYTACPPTLVSYILTLCLAVTIIIQRKSGELY